MRKILIVGGGYAGFYTAKKLEKWLGQREAEVTMVDPLPYMTYQPFLPEVAAGSLDPRHALVNHRRHLKRTKVITAKVTDIRHAREDGDDHARRSASRGMSSYDIVVVTAGAVTRTFPIPGLADQAIGLKNIEEAISIRDRMTDNFAKASNLPAGARARPPAHGRRGRRRVRRHRDLRRAAQLRQRPASASTPSSSMDDTHFHLIEAMDLIMPEVSRKTSGWVINNLEQRAATVHLDTQLASAVDGKIEMSNGETFESDLIVWTAGVMANPVLRNTDLPVEERGRLRVQADLRVIDDNGVVDDAWGAGDVCAVPDLIEGQGVAGFTVPNAQHAVRQGKLMARNLAAVLRGESPREYGTATRVPSPDSASTRACTRAGPIRDQGTHRLVHAPRLPRLRDADVGAQDPRLRRVDHQLPDPARPGRHPGPRHPACRLRGVRLAPEGGRVGAPNPRLGPAAKPALQPVAEPVRR